jgi:flavin reductase (DIM6/NTAB) family NADH-FMN oxidoreductase RutF
MPTFDAADLSGKEPYFLLTSLVVPRPIAWVSTLAPDGTVNLAPHSYFNIMSSEPPIVHFTSSGVKDSLRNVRESGEFVVNIVTADIVEEMNLTAVDFPPDISEMDWAGLAAAPSQHVRPPRVARAKAALECRVRQITSMGNGTMVFGEVLRFHVDDAIWVDGRVDPVALDPVCRLSGANYARQGEVFKIPRQSYDELLRSAD